MAEGEGGEHKHDGTDEGCVGCMHMRMSRVEEHLKMPKMGEKEKSRDEKRDESLVKRRRS